MSRTEGIFLEVSAEAYKRLEQIKEEQGLQSVDAVIRRAVAVYDCLVTAGASEALFKDPTSGEYTKKVVL